MTIRKNPQGESALWVEKYRPQSLAECLLPQSYRQVFEGFVARGEMPNLLLFGPTGVGKTSIAKLLANDMNRDTSMIDATIERNLDTITERVVTIASSRGFGGEKAIIFDEADYLNKQHSQPALSRCIEKFNHCRYLLTCNEPTKIIPRLKSRLMEFDFYYLPDEYLELMEMYTTRACEILKNENIVFQVGDVEEIVEYYLPDFRKTINELHRLSMTGALLPMRKAA